jgi:hypothetical protein
MKLKNQTRPRLPVQDYSHAIRNAVSWLGDRYLLAVPIDGHSINHSPTSKVSSEPSLTEFPHLHRPSAPVQVWAGQRRLRRVEETYPLRA